MEHLKVTQGPSITFKHGTRRAGDKHSNVFGPSINYVGKKFYNIGPSCRCYNEINVNLHIFGYLVAFLVSYSTSLNVSLGLKLVYSYTNIDTDSTAQTIL